MYYYYPRRRVGITAKWNKTYTGPYLVVGTLGHVLYRIQRTKNAQPLVVHVDRLAKCLSDTPQSWLTPEEELEPVLDGPLTLPLEENSEEDELRADEETVLKQTTIFPENIPTFNFPLQGTDGRPKRTTKRPQRFRRTRCHRNPSTEHGRRSTTIETYEDKQYRNDTTYVEFRRCRQPSTRFLDVSPDTFELQSFSGRTTSGELDAVPPPSERADRRPVLTGPTERTSRAVSLPSDRRSTIVSAGYGNRRDASSEKESRSSLEPITVGSFPWQRRKGVHRNMSVKIYNIIGGMQRMLPQ